MKAKRVNKLTTKPVSLLKKSIGLEPQILTLGDEVEVLSAFNGKVALKGRIVALFEDIDNGYVCGNIKGGDGQEFVGNGLGTVRKVETSNILKQNSTHEARLEGEVIGIYIKGFDFDGEYFEPEKIREIPVENEDDLLAIFDNFDEENRIMRHEFKREIKSI